MNGTRQGESQRGSRPESKYARKVRLRGLQPDRPAAPAPAEKPAPAPQPLPKGGILDGITWQLGRVKRYKDTAGYGFITVGEVDYFVHVSAFDKKAIPPALLYEGREVLVRLRPNGRKGPEVKSLKLAPVNTQV